MSRILLLKEKEIESLRKEVKDTLGSLARKKKLLHENIIDKVTIHELVNKFNDIFINYYVSEFLEEINEIINVD